VFFAVIFYCYSETIVATWVPTFLRQARNFGIQSAGLALTLFWLFIIIGRGITLIIAGRIKATKIMICISIIAITAFTVLIFLRSEYFIYALIALTGFGYSAMFPLLISTGSTLYEKGRGVLATGLFIASNIGISAAPFITKFTSRISLIFSVSFVMISMAVVTFLVVIVHVLISRNKLLKI